MAGKFKWNVAYHDGRGPSDAHGSLDDGSQQGMGLPTSSKTKHEKSNEHPSRGRVLA